MWAVGDYYTGIGGYQTLVEHWDGISWSVVSSPNVGTYTNHLNGVAAVSANDVWAVGSYNNAGVDNTLVEHWDGSVWSLVTSPNPGTTDYLLYGVAAVSANDVWAVGFYNGGTLTEHWNGTSWAVVPSPNVGNLDGVTAVSANDVWAVGSSVEHWDGTSWTVVPSPNGYLNGVAAVSANDVWAVGDYYTGTYQTLVEHYVSACTPTSTPTRTPTPNNTPGPALIVGHVTWQGPPAQPNDRQALPISMTLRLQSGGPAAEAAAAGPAPPLPRPAPHDFARRPGGWRAHTPPRRDHAGPQGSAIPGRASRVQQPGPRNAAPAFGG